MKAVEKSLLLLNVGESARTASAPRMLEGCRILVGEPGK